MELLEALLIVSDLAEQSAWDKSLAMSEECMDEFYQEQKALEKIRTFVSFLKKGEPKSC